MITPANDFILKPFNTFRINAKCREWIEYTSPSDIPAVMARIGTGKFINIGAGSNMLFENDFDGTVLHSRILDVDIKPHDASQIIVHAGAGVEMDSLICQLCQAGLWGLENLSGIPGEVGASAVQNVGAYGVEAADVILSVECFDTHENRFIEIPKDACDYGYRSSMFKKPENKNRYIITYVNFMLSSTPAPHTGYGSLKELSPEETATPLLIRNAIVSIRNQKLPAVDEVGSAGSFFKNPIVNEKIFEELNAKLAAEASSVVTIPHYRVDDGIKIPAAWLIDQCGLKSVRIGGAAVWHKQPLVIVNASGDATAADILSLEQHITSSVFERFGIKLEPEVEHIS